MDQSAPTKRALRYRVDRLIRTLVMRVISSLASDSQAQELDLRGHAVKRILLVRPNFRIGSAVLALPALAAFHKKLSEARIDFVGSRISRLLLENQPLIEHFETPRRFPGVLWSTCSCFAACAPTVMISPSISAARSLACRRSSSVCAAPACAPAALANGIGCSILKSPNSPRSISIASSQSS